MRYTKTLLFSLLVLLSFQLVAQPRIKAEDIRSGDYQEVRLSFDSNSKTITGVVSFEEGGRSCDAFFTGKSAAGNPGIFTLKIYSSISDNDTSSYPGKLSFYKNRFGKVLINLQLPESGSCLMIYDFKAGADFSFERAHAYGKFSVVKVAKAYAFADNLLTHRKGYLVQGDYVSVLSEQNDLCFIQYMKFYGPGSKSKKPPFKAWVRKSDLIF